MKNKRLTQKLIAAAGAVVLAAGLTAPAALAAQEFSDVNEGQWFKPYTDKVVDAGYMSGMGDGCFAPSGRLTLGQAMVLAYKVHSAGGGGSLPQASGAWYMPYYQYCLDNGIVAAGQFSLSDMDRDATRYEMVAILDKAVPGSRMEAVNDLPDGFIPDLSEDSAYGGTVYKWYRAGMLAGDETHRFNGGSSITRAEVSVILCQLTNLTDRIKLEFAPKPEPEPDPKPEPTPDPAPDPDTEDAQALIDEVVRLTNAERAKEGLPALKTFDALDEAAAIRAPETVEMFSHTRPDGSKCFTALDETGAKQGAYTYGENIAAGNSTPAATVEQWMNSPGHRANILNKDYTHIGVGYAAGGQYRHYWVQMFVGQRDASVPEAKEVTSVSLRAGKTELTVEETTTVTASVSPGDASDKALTWTSSNPDVAAVNSSGRVTALSAGRADITASASNGVKGTVTVTVTEPEPEPAPDPVPDPDTGDVQALIDEVVRLTNAERAKEGLPALKTFDALDEAAAIRAPETVGLFSHTRPDGSTCFTALDETGAKQGAYTYGENIAAGNSTPAATVEQWMNSPGHRANILNKDYTHIGVGYATGGQYGYYWVQMFVGKR